MLLRGDSDACDTNQADPGETYDPLGLADDPDTFAELKVNETKIGHLAMFSLLCYYMQAIVFGEGGVENSHISERYSTRRSMPSPAGYPRGYAHCLWLCVSHLGFMAPRPMVWGTSPRVAAQSEKTSPSLIYVV